MPNITIKSKTTVSDTRKENLLYLSIHVYFKANNLYV